MANGKHLVLLRGVSGCGKSTLAELFGIPTLSASFSTDDLFMVDGKYEFDPSKLGENHQMNINLVENRMIEVKEMRSWHENLGGSKNNHVILVHNTFTEVWEMDPYYALADKYIWTVHSIIVENRHFGKSIHDVPDNVLEAQKSRFNVTL